MTVVQVVLSNMAVNTDVLAPVTSTLDTLKTPCSKLGYLIPVTCQRPLVAQTGHSPDFDERPLSLHRSRSKPLSDECNESGIATNEKHSKTCDHFKRTVRPDSISISTRNAP